MAEPLRQGWRTRLTGDLSEPAKLLCIPFGLSKGVIAGYWCPRLILLSEQLRNTGGMVNQLLARGVEQIQFQLPICIQPADEHEQGSPCGFERLKIRVVENPPHHGARSRMQPGDVLPLLGIFPRHEVRSNGFLQKLRQIARCFRNRGWLVAGLLDQLVHQAAPRKARRPVLPGHRSNRGCRRLHCLPRLRQVAKNLCAPVNLIRMKVVHIAKLQCNARQADRHPHSGEHFIQVVAIDGNRAPSSKFGMQAATGPAAEIPKDQNPKRSVWLGWAARLLIRCDIKMDRTS
jgi:hypothetical protein